MKLETYLSLTGQTQSAFADRAEITQGAVSHVITGFRKATGDLCRRIGTASDWQVTPHDLRPDMYPNPWDGLPADRAMLLLAELRSTRCEAA